MKFLDKLILLIRSIIHNKKIFAIIFSVILSLSLWLIITYSKTYQQTFYYPISFKDKSNVNSVYFYSDSIISVKINSIGFDMLIFSKKENDIITFDVNEFNIDKSKGIAKIPMSSLKPKIKKKLGLKDLDIRAYPDTIILKWDKMVRKKIKVVSDIDFKFEKPFGAYGKPELLTKYVFIEGGRSIIQKIDSVRTKNIIIKDINKTSTFLVPLKSFNDSLGVDLLTKQVPVKINIEEYTENVVSVNVKPVLFKNKNEVKLFPSSVKIRYKVATKDYKKVNENEISAYVIAAENKSKKLKVLLSDIPDYIKVVNIQPEKVEYVIFK